MLPKSIEQQPIVSVPNSLREQLERAQMLVAQSEQASAGGYGSLAEIKARAAGIVLSRLTQTSPESAALLYLAERGYSGFEYEILDRTDQYQVIEHTFFGIPVGKEVVNVPTIKRRIVRGRIF